MHYFCFSVLFLYWDFFDFWYAMEEYDEILQAIPTEGAKKTLQTLFQQLQTSLEAKNKKQVNNLWRQTQVQLDIVRDKVDTTTQKNIQKYLEITKKKVNALSSVEKETKQALDETKQAVVQSQLPRYKRRRKKIWWWVKKGKTPQEVVWGEIEKNVNKEVKSWQQKAKMWWWTLLGVAGLGGLFASFVGNTSWWSLANFFSKIKSLGENLMNRAKGKKIKKEKKPWEGKGEEKQIKDEDKDHITTLLTPISAKWKKYRDFHTSVNRLWNILWSNKEEVERNLVSISFLWKDIRIHRYIAPYLLEANKEIMQDVSLQKYVQGIETIQTYAHRKKRWRQSLSTHGLGISLDIDPEKNAYRKHRPSWDNLYPRYTNIPPKFVAIMNKYWFYRWWDWSTPYDPMHFEFSNYDNIENRL